MLHLDQSPLVSPSKSNAKTCTTLKRVFKQYEDRSIHFTGKNIALDPFVVQTQKCKVYV